ncbi:MAG: tripartite tricarboxylate transporter substrate binding protein [Betaproteobacteria bacterium]|nr:tripartite tricarboxylate transporter substrate binding protein [Betaproteobacteria bacterium]
MTHPCSIAPNLWPLFAAALVWPGGSALAQTYPDKPVRIVIGFAPGGAVDFVARLVGQKLTESMGQAFVIENRPGAATSISAERVARAAADGHTLLLLPISTAVQSAVRKKLPYDLQRDIAPISQISIGPLLLVAHPSLPVRGIKDLIALARSRPGKLEWSSPGIGSANHFAGELLNLQTKVTMLHVPFKGSSEAVIAAATGQVSLCITSLAAATPMLQSGRLRPLAFTTAARVAALPEVPTIAEAAIPGFDYFTWYGLAAPAATPKNIVTRLNSEVGRITKLPDVKTALERQGMVAQPGTPEEFAAVIGRTIEQTATLIKAAGAQARMSQTVRDLR